MTTLKVEDMHCSKCVERIHNALEAADITHEISLDDKTVTIDGCEKCVAAAVSELDDIGYEAVEVK